VLLLCLKLPRLQANFFVSTTKHLFVYVHAHFYNIKHLITMALFFDVPNVTYLLVVFMDIFSHIYFESGKKVEIWQVKYSTNVKDMLAIIISSSVSGAHKGAVVWHDKGRFSFKKDCSDN
jgi:hypothetical protein